MEVNPVEVRSGVAIVHSSPSEFVDQLRTKESIDPRISVTLLEIDVQSAQYSCEVTIANAADEEFSVSEVRPRLPKGVKLNEAFDSAQVALGKRYQEICRTTGALMTSATLLAGQDLATQNAKRLRESMREALKPRNLLDMYLAPLFGRVPQSLQKARERDFKIEVNCSADASGALKAFPLAADSADRQLIEYNISLLKRIEADQDFQRTRTKEVSLKKGQQYKAIYIVCGTRGALNPTSYSISFDIVLRRESYFLSRVEYATVTVPPAPFWPTVVAMASAAIGWLIEAFRPVTAAGATTPKAASASFLSTDPLVLATGLAVPILTALIVYNIYDMTALKDRVKASRSWRSAVFVGFLCGFLNERILAALGALLK
jgi:hypothetical protein